MAIPRFFDRFADAALPLLEGADRAAVRSWLDPLGVTLRAPREITGDAAHEAGFLLACNLCARLYPKLHIDAPDALAGVARELALAINPAVELLARPRADDVTLCWAIGEPQPRAVVVSARGWTAHVDEPGDEVSPCEAPAALAAAAIGAAYVFRSAFGDRLGQRARTRPEPGRLNVVTQDERVDALPPLGQGIDLGVIHLAGCGAIGEAFVLTLRHMAVRGTLWAVDHENVELTNLQRYVLATDTDVRAKTRKTKLVAAALSDSDVTVKQLATRWGEHRSAGPGAEIVVTALDSGADRIDVQGALPRALYNAFTGPLDLGVSRHECFGEDPCLACLYWPDRTVPGRHEQIATALAEHPLRTLGYLVRKVPIGEPLPPDAIAPADHKELPKEAATWAERSLLGDIAERWTLQGPEVEPWSGAQLEDFYVGAICGGALVIDADTGDDVTVPLAHQSALAGILLAVELLVAQHPELRQHRRCAGQGRVSLLEPLRARTGLVTARTPGCLCADDDFVGHWRRQWTA